MDKTAQNDREEAKTCQSIDWYSEGEARTVEVHGQRIEVRLIGRRGRRARIAICAPPGARFADGTSANEKRP